MNHQDLSACLRAIRGLESEDIVAAGIPMTAADHRSFLRDPETFYVDASDERQKSLFRLIVSRCRDLVLPIEEALPSIPLNEVEILDQTDIRRERNRPVAEAGNAVREREDTGALSRF